jgi:hypothetical protein
VITITAKPPAVDEYTPEQRRTIDAQLDKAAKGPFHGPFDTADDVIAHIKGQTQEESCCQKPQALSMKIKHSDAVTESRENAPMQ